MSIKRTIRDARPDLSPLDLLTVVTSLIRFWKQGPSLIRPMSVAEHRSCKLYTAISCQ